MDPRQPEAQDRPPVNYEAEQAMLGAILANNRAYDMVVDFQRAEHFADGAHGRVYQACANMIEHGRVANAVTLKNHFEHDEALVEVGGAVYLAKLQASYVTIINAPDYGKVIRDLYLRRELIAIAEQAIDDARLGVTSDQGDAQALLEEVGTDIAVLGEEGAGTGAGPVSFQSASADWLNTIEAAVTGGGIVGVPTGLSKLDKHLGGLGAGHLIVVGGCTSMGKTALAKTIGFNAAHAGRRTLFWTLEMTDEEIAGGMLAGSTGISTDRQRRGKISAAELAQLRQARDVLAEIPLQIEEPYIRTVGALRSRARGIKRKNGLDLIIVDYIQQLSGAGRSRGYENRTQELTGITRDLKALAKDLSVPIVALAQLSREVDKRDDKRPRLGDLRESGSIEQDADVVILMYREFYYLSREAPKKRGTESSDAFTGRLADWEAGLNRCRDIGEAIVAKFRHGPIGTIELCFDGPGTVFRDEPQGSMV